MNESKYNSISVTGTYGDKNFDPYMIRIPEVQQVEYKDSTYFIVASDGLVLKEDQILNLVIEKITQKASNQSIARALTEATIHVSRDDTTIIFIQADLLPPDSVTRYDVTDGHGQDSENISGAITNFIRKKHQKPQSPESNFDLRIDRESLAQFSLTMRRQNLKQREFGWLSEEEFISLSTHPLFLSWISLHPSKRLQENLNGLIFSYVDDEYEIKEQIQTIDKIEDLSPSETLCRDWLRFRLNMQARHREYGSNYLNLTHTFMTANQTLTQILQKFQLEEKQENKQVEMMVRPKESSSHSEKFQSLLQQALKIFLSRFAIFIKKNKLKHLKLIKNEYFESSSDDINIFTQLMDQYYQLKIKSVNSIFNLSASNTVNILDKVLSNFKFVINWSFFASSLETALDNLQSEAKPTAAVHEALSAKERQGNSAFFQIPYPPEEEDEEEDEEAPKFPSLQAEV